MLGGLLTFSLLDPQQSQHCSHASWQQIRSSTPCSGRNGGCKIVCWDSHSTSWKPPPFETTNVDNAFAEVLKQIDNIVIKKTMEASDAAAAAASTVVAKGEKIDISKDVSGVKKGGFCSS